MRGDLMKVNKTISIDLNILNEMLAYCKKKGLTFSGLVAEMWKAYSKTFK
jgi:hypothetical protein